MEDILTVELPGELSDAEVKALRDEIRQMSGVEDAGSQKARGVGPARPGIWVQLPTGALGAASGVPIVQKIAETVRDKGIKGAKITLANGAMLSIDEISSRDLEKIFKAFSQAGTKRPPKKK